MTGSVGRFLLIISLLRAKNSSNLCSIWIITVRQQENETALKGGKRKIEITPSPYQGEGWGRVKPEDIATNSESRLG